MWEGMAIGTDGWPIATFDILGVVTPQIPDESACWTKEGLRLSLPRKQSSKLGPTPTPPCASPALNRPPR